MRQGSPPTRQLVALFEAAAADRDAIGRRRRPASVPLDHPGHTAFTPLDACSHEERRRGELDRVREVADHLVEHYMVPGKPP